MQHTRRARYLATSRRLDLENQHCRAQRNMISLPEESLAVMLTLFVFEGQEPDEGFPLFDEPDPIIGNVTVSVGRDIARDRSSSPGLIVRQQLVAP
eukprot:687948-Rhodomonas_salina.1